MQGSPSSRARDEDQWLGLLRRAVEEGDLDRVRFCLDAAERLGHDPKRLFARLAPDGAGLAGPRDAGVTATSEDGDLPEVVAGKSAPGDGAAESSSPPAESRHGYPIICPPELPPSGWLDTADDDWSPEETRATIDPFLDSSASGSWSDFAINCPYEPSPRVVRTAPREPRRGCGHSNPQLGRLCWTCDDARALPARTAPRRARRPATVRQRGAPGRRALRIFGGLSLLLVAVALLVGGSAHSGQPATITPAASIPMLAPAAVPVTPTPMTTSAAPTVQAAGASTPYAPPSTDGGRIEEGIAVETLLALKRAAPETPGIDDALIRAYLAHGRDALDRQDFDLSWAMYGEVLKLRPSALSAAEGKKQVILAKHWAEAEGHGDVNPDAAIAALEEVVSVDPRYRDVQRELYDRLLRKADRLLGAGNRASALPILMRAIELDGDTSAARQRLASYTPTPTPPPAPGRTPTTIPALMAPPPPPVISAPPPTASVAVSPANGTYLLGPSYPSGLGSLEISNGTLRDAVAKLKTAGADPRTKAAIYIRAGARVTLPNIGPGTYVLQFQTGADWDQTNRSFRRDASTYQFEDDFVFQQPPTAGGTRYWAIDVSLHTVPGGAAHTDPISTEAFAVD